MSTRTQAHPLAAHDQALTGYFESLLNAQPAALPRPVPDPAAAPRPETEQPVPRAGSVPPAPPATPITVEPPPAVPGAPPWAATPFRCQLVNIAGLTLAVPTVRIAAVLSEACPKAAGTEDPPWQLGLLDWQDRPVRVVDAAWWILPPERRLPATGRWPGGKMAVVIVADGRYGLACEALAEIVALEPAAVRWRSDRTQRPWLAGTLLKQAWVLLDVEGLTGLLA